MFIILISLFYLYFIIISFIINENDIIYILIIISIIHTIISSISHRNYYKDLSQNSLSVQNKHFRTYLISLILSKLIIIILIMRKLKLF